MNRLILVGNGFDLAHGLKTSYQDFIDDFWSKQLPMILERQDSSFKNHFVTIDHIQSDIPIDKIKRFGDLNEFVVKTGRKIHFDNKFLKTISEKRSLQNWVDIEKEYFNQLFTAKSEANVEKVNEDFEEIKNLFIDYLNKIDKEYIFNEKIYSLLLSSFHLKDLTGSCKKAIITLITENLNEYKKNNSINNWDFDTINFIRDFNRITDKFEQDKYIIDHFDNLGNSKNQILNFYPTQTLLLNFNYTDTIEEYRIRFEKNNQFNDLNISRIDIHGNLNNKQNPIIFGFGDDIDEKYKDFENLDDNRFLRNFKSIAYLQTDSYKKLLEFIDSEDYQVFIFGHSCGISDRTMLNTIFEHDNCKSVKPLFHKRQGGSDNYTDIVQNISRNFNDKKKFRDRVVNKTDCEPLS